jgi:acyl dehydratase
MQEPMQKTITISEVQVGQELPDLDIPVNATLVVGGALASRDYTPVHHDRGAAVANGLPDVFMNILTTQGLCSRYVTDWAGPDALVKSVKTKLGGPMLPGDTLKLRAKVVAVEAPRVDVEVAGNNAWGNHVTATFSLELPGN